MWIYIIIKLRIFQYGRQHPSLAELCVSPWPRAECGVVWLRESALLSIPCSTSSAQGRALPHSLPELFLLCRRAAAGRGLPLRPGPLRLPLDGRPRAAGCSITRYRSSSSFAAALPLGAGCRYDPGLLRLSLDGRSRADGHSSPKLPPLPPWAHGGVRASSRRRPISRQSRGWKVRAPAP